MRLVVVLFFAILPVVSVLSQNLSVYEKRWYVSPKGDSLPYRIMFPENYHPDRQYPMVLFLHGSGERGNDNESQLVHGGRLFADPVSRRRYPSIVVFPQCPAGEFWSEIASDTSLSKQEWDFPFTDKPLRPMQLVIELLNQLTEAEAVDARRIYVAGLSMGGFGTFELLARQPGRFAAAIPICGGGNELLTPLYAPMTSMWIFHGAEDKVVPADYSRKMFFALKKEGGSVRYTEFPDTGHNSWDLAFEEPGLMKWMYSQTLKALEGLRYWDEVFRGIQRETRIYSTKEGEDLKLDLYLPREDNANQRPLVLYVHGGGFAGGARDEPLHKQFARQLARRGYAVASMSYRLTMKGKSFSCDQPTPNKIRTFQAAVEDIRDATNYLLGLVDTFSLNPRRIILAGSSAGAEAVLHAAYWGDKDLPVTSPKLPKGFRYSGVISMAGALVDTNLVNRKTAIPTQLFHGTCDNLVPYASAPHHYCQPGDPGYLPLHGGFAIAERLRRLGSSYYLYTSCSGGHEWASLPMRSHEEVVIDFLYNDIIRGEFRQLHRKYIQEGECELVKGIKVCE